MVRRIRRPLVALLLSVSAGGFPPAAAQDALRGLDGYVEKAMRDWNVPGLSVAVVHKDSLIYAKGFGVLEMGKTDRVDEHTLFAIGSQSKAFTAAAIGILVDEGKVRWDDPVERRLPGFELANPYLTREVTLRDLISHRTGLPGNNLIFWGTDLTRAQIVDRLRFLQPTASLRSRYQYQNLMFIAAGEVIRAVTGQTWDDLVRSRIFGPLGMTRSETSVGAILRAKPPNVATPHNDYSGRTAPAPWLDLDNAGPAGSIVSSAVDMAQWYRLQLGHGSYRGRTVLSGSVADEMHSPQTIVQKDPFISLLFPRAEFVLYGLGWFMHSYHGHEIIEHGGQTDGMRSAGAMLPDQKLGVIVLTNEVDNLLAPALVYRIFDAFLALPAQDWSQTFQRAARESGGGSGAAPARVTATKPTLELGRYAGTYRHDFYGDAVVRVENGGLELRLLGFTTPLEHWHYDTFRAARAGPVSTMMGRLVSFGLDARADVDRLTIRGGADFRRIREAASR